MKKAILFYLVIFSLVQCLKAQTTYEDAFLLSKYYKGKDFISFSQLLLTYVKKHHQSDTVKYYEIPELFDRNIFLNGMITSFEKDYEKLLKEFNDSISKIQLQMSTIDTNKNANQRAINYYNRKKEELNNEISTLNKLSINTDSINKYILNITERDTLLSKIADYTGFQEMIRNMINNREKEITIFDSKISELTLLIVQNEADNVKNKEIIKRLSKTLAKYMNLVYVDTLTHQTSVNFNLYIKQNSTCKEKENFISSNSVSGLNFQTNLYDGAAKFIAERFKEEINIYFMEKLKNFARDSCQFKALFPSTYKTLMMFKPWDFSMYMGVLKSSVENDLQTIIFRIPYIEKTCFPLKNEKTFQMLKAAILCIEKVANGEHPINSLAVVYNDESFDSNIRAKLRFMEIILNHLYDRNGNILTTEQLIQLRNDKYALVFYLGLVMEEEWYKLTISDIKLMFQHYNVFIKNNMTSDELMDFAGDIYNKLINPYVNIMSVIETNIANVKSNPTVQNYLNYTVSVSELMQQLLSIPEINNMTMGTNEIEIKFENDSNFTFLFNNLISAYQSGLSKDYSGVIMNLIPVFDTLFADNDEVKTEIFKYATFCSLLAQAQNSEDVKNVIQTIALPPGSYSVKRNSIWNISLNAYAGIAANRYPWLSNEKNKPINSLGFTTPIGISVNKGLLKKPGNIDKTGKYSNGSLSVFLSLIDLGALVEYRLNDSASVVPGNIQFSDVASPGAYLIYGFNKSPISVFISGNYSPKLTKVNSEELVTQNNSWRFSIGAFIDIPIVNFYTKTYKK
jgi:hypothetical protein